MCGFAGAIESGVTAAAWEDRLRAMAAPLRHRGPDDHGSWHDAAAGVGLAHRRLSILDLSPEGHQPMRSPSGRYVIAYNGEVYNFRDLREEIGQPATPWRGHSDTEVILAAIDRWGVEPALGRFVGMFAFALWDREDRVLHLARDRLGIKPLYYGWSSGVFLFGSEIKALRAHPEFDRPVDRGALALFLRHNYIPAPHSIYADVYKLEPGHLLRLPLGRTGSAEVAPRCYWSMRQVAENGQAGTFRGPDDEAVERLDELLRSAVKLRMVADVPLGAFLSGGVDSSAIVALMQAQSTAPVKTFTIGFEEEGFDEARYARPIAAHLGTDHTELYVTPADALAVIPKLPTMFDEPFSDSSQIPTYLVSELARRDVTVSLSGDGGDELFAGYGRYATARDLWGTLGRMPVWSRRLIASVLHASPQRLLDVGLGWTRPLFRRYGRPTKAGDKLKKLADMLDKREPEALYRDLVSHWKRPADVVLGAGEKPTALTAREQWPALQDLTHRMMYFDSISYLPDDILVKVDRSSMSVSLEARVPLLDHRVVELAWSLPLSMKVRDGGSKWVLRQVLYRYVPRALIDRPKMGFGVPIRSWLRGPLREWAEDLLDPARLRREGFFDPDPIRRMWREHLDGDRVWHYYLWDVLMFQAWLEAERPVGACMAV